MYFRDFIGTSYFTIGIQLTQPCHNSKYYGDYYITGPVTVSSGGRLLLTNEMDMPTTPLTVTLSNPITVENNGLVVLDAYAKDYNRNIATTYKMVDGYDGPAIIVEEGGTLAVNAAKCPLSPFSFVGVALEELAVLFCWTLGWCCLFHPISLVLPKETGWSPKEKRLWGGGAPVRFRDPPASPTRVGGATRPLRCPLRGRIGSLAPGARGLGWM